MKNIWQVLVATFAATALGAAAQEITFYYPIAVGGPITKIVDRWPPTSRRRTPASR